MYYCITGRILKFWNAWFWLKETVFISHILIEKLDKKIMEMYVTTYIINVDNFESLVYIWHVYFVTYLLSRKIFFILLLNCFWMLRFLNFRVYNLFFYLWSYEWKIYENNLHVYLYTLERKYVFTWSCQS